MAEVLKLAEMTYLYKDPAMETLKSPWPDNLYIYFLYIYFLAENESYYLNRIIFLVFSYSFAVSL